jgi:hypothetical protein
MQAFARLNACFRSQTTLDALLIKPPPRITTEGVLEYLGEFVVSDNQSFNLVSNGGFRRFVHYVAPTLKDRQLP